MPIEKTGITQHDQVMPTKLESESCRILLFNTIKMLEYVISDLEHQIDYLHNFYLIWTWNQRKSNEQVQHIRNLVAKYFTCVRELYKLHFYLSESTPLRYTTTSK